MNSLVLETIAFVANTDYSIHGRVELIKKLLETPPEKEDVTPEPSQQVQNVTQGKPGCNPANKKKYLTAEGMREYDGSKWV